MVRSVLTFAPQVSSVVQQPSQACELMDCSVEYWAPQDGMCNLDQRMPALSTSVLDSRLVIPAWGSDFCAAPTCLAREGIFVKSGLGRTARVLRTRLIPNPLCCVDSQDGRCTSIVEGRRMTARAPRD